VNTQKQILVIVVLVFAMVGGCAAYTMVDIPHRAVSQTKWTQDESITRGALLFANNCRTCHGIQGEGGIGLVLNKDDFKNQDPLILKANRDLIQRTLQCGRAGTLMPAWLRDNGGSLNAEQITHIVDFITAPLDPKLTDEQGNPTNRGWQEALDFAHNLNRANQPLIGGDTLDTIASAHNLGAQELAVANGATITTPLTVGDTLIIPPFKALPNGYEYHVYKSNETFQKVADSQHVGAMILADLNDLSYKFTQSKDKADYTLLDGDGQPVTGLFPGDTLKLPDGSTYDVTAGDTVTSIAARHGVAVGDVASLNQALIGGVANDQPIDYQNKLKLPTGTKAILQTGQTLAAVASQHGVAAADMEKANSLAPGAQPAPGTALSLPADAKYVIQTGDTIDKVAKLHGISAQDLAAANGLQPGAPISPDVVFKLPKVDAYVVKGQSLDDLGKTYSNVTADSLGQANGIPANAIIRIGTKLTLPPDAWGSKPPDTLNNGLACVQNAVPSSVFQTLPGIGTPVAVETPAVPTTTAKSVEITTGATDFTVNADGTKSDPNKGNVAVGVGTAIKFTNNLGLHTINLNGKQDGDLFKQGDTRTITFKTPGQFKITCSFHPDMLAFITVQ
jgi:LysM repeat protein/plastocyanin/mono/diheme cytochrome c family protein